MLKSEFQEKCAQRGLSLTKNQLKQFEIYADALLDYNQKINLTAITKKEDVYQKHFYDSLLPSFHVPLQGKLADIGTGAGFPGLALKIAYPELEVSLIEANGKRCRFLEEMIDLLALTGVWVQQKRGEDFARQEEEKYDICTARAVASLPVLLEISARCLKKGGYYLAYRAAKGYEEIQNAENAAKKLCLQQKDIWQEELGDALRVFAYYRKEKKTPSSYPRLYAEINKKPL